MKKIIYILINSHEYELCFPLLFKTYEEAYKEMEEQFDECKRGEDGKIEKYNAYCENLNHDRINWRIFAYSL